MAIFSTAIRARASLTGFLPLPMKASMAWVMASMAVAAVMGSGSPWVRRGIQHRQLGQQEGGGEGHLAPAPSSLITATRVTSEPVPAVVGTTASGEGPGQAAAPRIQQPLPPGSQNVDRLGGVDDGAAAQGRRLSQPSSR
jgi:hypothetical protein